MASLRRVSFRAAVAVVLVVVFAIILVPIILLVLTGFSSVSPLLGGWAATLDVYGQMAKQPTFAPFLRNTVAYTAGAGVISLVFAMLFAGVITSIELPAQRLLRFLPLTPLILPGLLKDPAWVELYSPRTGLVNLALMHVLGLSTPPFNIYSMLGMITMAGINLVPIPYLILLGPFESLDRSLVDASRVSGARFTHTVRKIVMPVLAPAILSALLLTVIIVMSGLETPLIVGLPVGILTFVSAIYNSVGSGNYNLASAQASIYLGICALLLWWYLRATRRERRFVTVTGRGHFHSRRQVRGWLRYVLVFSILSYTVVAFVLPLANTALISLTPFYTTTNGFPFSRLALTQYHSVLSDSTVLRSMVNSTVLSVVVTLCTLLAAGLIAVVTLKSHIPGRRYLDLVATLPIAVPAMVYSVMLLITFLTIPGIGLLYTTLVPLVVAEMVVFIPLTVRILSSAVVQIHDELLEASTLSGATVLQTTRSILFPLLRPAVAYAAAALVVVSFREFGAAVLLVTPNTELVPTVTFDYWRNSNFETVAALNVIGMVVPFAVAAGIFLIGTPRRNVNSRLQPRLLESVRSPTADDLGTIAIPAGRAT